METERLLIQEYKSEDIKELYKILSDSITMSFWLRPFTLAETESNKRNRDILTFVYSVKGEL